MIASNRGFHVGADGPEQQSSWSEADFRYIPSPEFAGLTLAQLLSESPDVIHYGGRSSRFEDHAASSVKQGLLTPAGERHLFKLMNFLKFQASGLRNRRTRILKRGAIEWLLAEARAIRDIIVNANVRLVAAVSRKFGEQDVDELTSEGHVILLASVEKFSYIKGFRFSTYATNALQRHSFRILQRRRIRRRRESLVSTEFLAGQGSKPSTEKPLDPRLAQFFVDRLEACLSDREQMILCERFGLNGRIPLTLKAVAERVGLSKERVRQLQMSALSKLQDLATQHGLKLDSSENPLAV